MAAAAAETCSTHPGARAAWRCEPCERLLCPRCAALQPAGRLAVVVCARCGQYVPQLVVRRAMPTRWHSVRGFVRSMVTFDGLIQIFGIAAILWVVGILPPVGSLLAGGVWVGYLFAVIRKAADGEEHVPELEDFVDVSDYLPALGRFMLATALLWGPALFWIIHGIGLGVLIERPGLALADPVLMLIVVASVLYFPAAIITAAITESTLAMLNPLMILGIVLRIPGPYVATVGLWILLTAADVALTLGTGMVLRHVPVPVVTSIVGSAIGLVIPMVTAFVFGRLIYEHGATLGYARESEYLVPAWPEARPEGVVPPPAR